MAVARMARATDPLWVSRLIDTLMAVPDADGVSASTLAGAWRDARQRLRFLNEVPVRGESEFPEGQAAEWLDRCDALAVEHGGMTLLPAFQFSPAGMLHPDMGVVLAILERPGWAAATWFAAPNEHLGDRRPLEMLWEDPERVAHAARLEFPIARG